MRTGGGDLRRLAHGRDRDLGAAARRALLQRLLSNDVDEARRRRRAVQRAVPRGRRRARRPLHLPARRRPLPDGHERRQPREGPRLVRASTPRASTSRSTTGSPTGRCSRSRARARGTIVQALRRRRRCPSASSCATLHARRPRGARLRHRLHGRGRRRGALPAATPRARSGTRRCAGGAVPAGPRRARHAAPGGLLTTSTATT